MVSTEETECGPSTIYLTEEEFSSGCRLVMEASASLNFADDVFPIPEACSVEFKKVLREVNAIDETGLRRIQFTDNSDAEVSPS